MAAKMVMVMEKVSNGNGELMMVFAMAMAYRSFVAMN